MASGASWKPSGVSATVEPGCSLLKEVVVLLVLPMDLRKAVLKIGVSELEVKARLEASEEDLLARL